MQTTISLVLEPENAAFLEALQDRMEREDANALINRLLRQEREERGLPGTHSEREFLDQVIDDFEERRLPGAD